VIRPVYFDDLELSVVREYDGISVSAEEIIAFAKTFDPEPFHIDPIAARETHFGELVASGAHTFALWRRLGFESQRQHGWATMAGAGMDEMRLLLPVKPGDRLCLRAELIDKTPSRSKPDRGLIRTRETVMNQHGNAVISMVCLAIISRRTPG
jgi:acyl dehydratase